MCMWVGMEEWCSNRSIVRRPELPTINEHQNPELSRLVDVAYNNQNVIGWYHFCLGRISKEWKMCIRKWYDVNDEKANGKAEGCTRAIIENIWKMMLKLWKVRNDVEHGNNMMCSNRDMKILLEIVDELYRRFSAIAENDDKWIFEKNINDRKQESVVTIATWVELVSTLYLTKNNEDIPESELNKILMMS